MPSGRIISQLILSVFLSLLVSQSANAVGVGDISVKSRLGQPLLAEITLLTTPSDDLESIKAKLAPAAIYKRTGLDMEKARNLKFRVVNTGSGDAKIVITTIKGYNEPTLNFIIHILWDGGSIMKEYKLLLDPA
jgi:pilus assembly protein FimV